MSEAVTKTTELDEYKGQIEAIVNQYSARKGALIAVLYETQNLIGFLPREVIHFIADRMHISVKEVYGIVTFYNFFTMKPRGKYPVAVCLGTACYVRGGRLVLDTIKKSLGIQEGDTTEDRKFSLELLRCLGACGLAPVMTIGKEVYGRLTPAKVKAILETYS
ncbi:MAG: NADP-reducing hydrogenase subunit HndA [candidate division WS2 bacterium]|uniref:NADP-reducing hydrogenase subunit HndA n=1 Tax=Psychracetigena formicireducens TaxID=2986056 RepID=A0A9E2BFV6_PSYF1|nr:NADP-reducing hydrogenase subunit HndA [Candidatus Psychracetigena formicireducens]MBT9144752.1 NADP-reducing hydrogenase subunit HndA [Candidatus Psychracetigena formicireducens]